MENCAFLLYKTYSIIQTFESIFECTSFILSRCFPSENLVFWDGNHKRKDYLQHQTLNQLKLHLHVPPCKPVASYHSPYPPPRPVQIHTHVLGYKLFKKSRGNNIITDIAVIRSRQCPFEAAMLWFEVFTHELGFRGFDQTPQTPPGYRPASKILCDEC